jgi:hypothetical protein
MPSADHVVAEDAAQQGGVGQQGGCGGVEAGSEGLKRLRGGKGRGAHVKGRGEHLRWVVWIRTASSSSQVGVVCGAGWEVRGCCSAP